MYTQQPYETARSREQRDWDWDFHGCSTVNSRASLGVSPQHVCLKSKNKNVEFQCGLRIVKYRGNPWLFDWLLPNNIVLISCVIFLTCQTGPQSNEKWQNHLAESWGLKLPEPDIFPEKYRNFRNFQVCYILTVISDEWVRWIRTNVDVNFTFYFWF